MRIAFCGHSYIPEKNNVHLDILACLSSLGLDENHTFLLGGYGDFDSVALAACNEYKKMYSPDSSVCFVTPYNTEEYFVTKKDYLKKYDEIVYPELEKVPPRYAILQRNKWMAQTCDLLICYIQCHWGGAFYTYSQAVKRKKRIINLAK